MEEIGIEEGIQILREIEKQANKIQDQNFGTDEELREALMKKDLTTISQSLLEDACTVNTDIRVLKFLLEKKCPIQSIYRNSTPLHQAFYPPDRVTSFEMVKFLVENNAGLNIKNSDMETPLISACKNKQITFETLKYMIEMKAQFDNTIGFTHHNYSNKLLTNPNLTLEHIKYLLEQKWDPTPKNTENKIDLSVFFRYNGVTSLETLKFFVEKDESLLTAKSSTRRVYFFHEACGAVSLEAIQYLLDKKCSLDTIDNEQQMPVHCALSNKDYRVTKYLFDIGAPLFLNYTSFVIPNTKINTENLIVLLSQPQYLFVNKYKYLKPPYDITKEYEEGSLWNMERNKYFPLSSQLKIFNLILCIKHFSKNHKIIFPKPLVWMMIEMLFWKDETNRETIIMYYSHKKKFMVFTK